MLDLNVSISVVLCRKHILSVFEERLSICLRDILIQNSSSIDAIVRFVQQLNCNAGVVMESLHSLFCIEYIKSDFQVLKH